MPLFDKYVPTFGHEITRKTELMKYCFINFEEKQDNLELLGVGHPTIVDDKLIQRRT